MARPSFSKVIRTGTVVCFAAAGVFAGLDGEVKQARLLAGATLIWVASSILLLRPRG